MTVQLNLTSSDVQGDSNIDLFLYHEFPGIFNDALPSLAAKDRLLQKFSTF